MEIRKAKFSDIVKIKQIADECTPNITAHSLFVYHLINFCPISTVLVAKDIGFLIAFQNPITSNIFLYQLGVAKKHRGKGIGESLLQKVLDKFKGKKISFGVRKFNKLALSFYKRLGFKITDEHFWFNQMFKMEK